jgi:thymidylate synthase (FAD)
MKEAKLKVLLVKHTPEPEATVAMAAKLCYSPSDIVALQGKIQKKDQKAFVQKLVKMGHMSPVEHVSFTFAIEGISRACSHQLVRHRLASYSQQSQRYVSEESGFDYIIPPTIKADKELKRKFVHSMADAQKIYNDLVISLNANGIKGEAANQDARFALPNAAETKIIVTMNARELIHFFRQRCCNRAQWEIRAMAEKMLKLARKAAPVIFEYAGPGCLGSSCPEGEYTCGKIKEVRKKYGIKTKSKKK